MTLKHISFQESAVMRELERQAVKKGHFDPTPEEIVSAAAYQIRKAKELEPSDNLEKDLLTLAAALRERGYETNASELESKLGFFKSAEVHLYRVHDEDGEDVLNFAHPEKDVQMDDRGSPYGKVFSPTEKARIIHEVVKKAPSGKLAVAAAMLKKAQEKNVDELKNEAIDAIDITGTNPLDSQLWYKFTFQRVLTNKTIMSLYSALAEVPMINLADYGNKYKLAYGDQPPEASTLQKKIMSFGYQNVQQLVNWGNSIEPGFGDTHFKGNRSTAPNLGKVLMPKNPLLSAPNPASVWTVNPASFAGGVGWDIDPGAAAKAANDLQVILQEKFNKNFAGIDAASKKLQDGLTKTVNKIRSKDLSKYTIKDLMPPDSADYHTIAAFNPAGAAVYAVKMNELYNALPERPENTPDWYNPDITARRYSDAAKILRDLAERLPNGDNKNIAIENAGILDKLAASVSGGKYDINKMVKDFEKAGYPVKNFYDIDRHSIDSLNFANDASGKQPQKKSSEDAEVLIKEAQAAPPGLRSFKGPAGGGGKAVGGRPTKDERDAVARMQQYLSYLATGLINEKTRLAKELGTNEAQLDAWSKPLMNTGGKIPTFDGKWGPNTSEALVIVNKIIALAKNAKRYDGSEVDSNKHYMKDSAGTVTSAADANVKTMADLASSLQLGKYFNIKDKERHDVVYDAIPDRLTDDNWRVPGNGYFELRSRDLDNLANFYFFVAYNNLKTAATIDKLKKLAEHIVSTDIIKEAQVTNIYDPAAGPISGLNQPGASWVWPGAPKDDPRVSDSQRNMQNYEPPKPKEEQPLPKQLTIPELENVLAWFWKRAHMMMYTATHPVKGQKEDPAKVAQAQEYVNKMRKLYAQFYRWKAQREPTASTLPGSGGERGAAYSKEHGGGREGRSGMGGVSIPTSKEEEAQLLSNPPIRDYINIKELASQWDLPSADFYAWAIQSPTLYRPTLDGEYIWNIMQSLISDQASNKWSEESKQSNTAYAEYLPLVNLIKLLYGISRDIRKVYDKWVEQVDAAGFKPELAEKVKIKQLKLVEKWQRVLAGRARSGVNYIQEKTGVRLA